MNTLCCLILLLSTFYILVLSKTNTWFFYFSFTSTFDEILMPLIFFIFFISYFQYIFLFFSFCTSQSLLLKIVSLIWMSYFASLYIDHYSVVQNVLRHHVMPVTIKFENWNSIFFVISSSLKKFPYSGLSSVATSLSSTNSIPHLHTHSPSSLPSASLR